MNPKQAIELVGRLFAAYPSIYLDDDVSAVWVEGLLPLDVEPVTRAFIKIVNPEGGIADRHRLNWPTVYAYIRAEISADAERERQRHGLAGGQLTDGNAAMTEQEWNAFKRAHRGLFDPAGEKTKPVELNESDVRGPDVVAAELELAGLKERGLTPSLPEPPSEAAK